MKKRQTRPKEVHPSTYYPEMAPVEDDPFALDQRLLGETTPIKYVPWSDLPISEITGLSYDPDLVQQWPPHRNKAVPIEIGPDTDLGLYIPDGFKDIRLYTPTERAAKKEYVRRMIQDGHQYSLWFLAPVESLVRELETFEHGQSPQEHQD